MHKPGTKGAGDENFPVGSWLIDRRLRPTVMAYYAMARAADDVADDPRLPTDEKLRRLDRFEAALAGRLDAPDVEVAVRARHALADANVSVEHATRLLRAFRRDAAGLSCADWADLMSYCADSAAPVGRFLLDLHGEKRTCYPASDALCAALQVINHLQDCRDDYRHLHRVYLPADWLAAQGVAVDALGGAGCTPGLRPVLDRCLAEVEGLLERARPLPRRVRSTRLALESAVIIRIAEVLTRELRRRDPLAEHVGLSRPTMLRHGAGAVMTCLAARLSRPIGHQGQPA